MNSLQKIILFVYSIVVSALCLFFMPYHNLKENNIFFESILYEPDYMYIIIDNQRLIIILLVITIFFGCLFFIFKSFQLSLNDKQKKIFRNELKLFVLFISLNLFALLSMGLYNGYLTVKEKNLISKNKEIKKDIEELFLITNIRMEFWEMSRYVFDLKEYNNDIGLFWNFLYKNKDDKEWANYFISNFDDERKIYFKIKDANEFKKFIEDNVLTDDYLQQQKTKIYLEADIFQNEEKIKKIEYLDQDKFVSYYLFFLLTTLFLFYILRYLLKSLRLLFNI